MPRDPRRPSLATVLCQDLIPATRFILYFMTFFRKNKPMTNATSTLGATSALLSFTARNVRSYWNEVNLSLLGTRLSEDGVIRDVGIAGSPAPVSVLPVAGIFGANASGKSTILRAIADMRAMVLGSFRRGDRETKLTRHSFLLHSKGPERPSCFAIDLVLEGVRWQYGFDIDDHLVLAEYAYHYPKGRRALVFRRNRDGREPSFGPAFRSLGRALARLVRKNALLLSVAGAVADGSGDKPRGITNPLYPLFAWFRTSLGLMEADNRRARIAHTTNCLEYPERRGAILDLLRAADLGITEMERVQIDPELAERLQRALRILDGREDESGTGREEQLLLSDLVRLHHMGAEGPAAIEPEHESQGTLAWTSMLGPLLDILGNGSAALVDELDESLHPHLVQMFIRLFQNPTTNPRCAQLIFNANDTTILGYGGQRFLGRDQIWLTEKNADGATTLYSMAEFRPKRDEALGRRYLQGRYGGVPVLDPAAFQFVLHARDRTAHIHRHAVSVEE